MRVCEIAITTSARTSHNQRCLIAHMQLLLGMQAQYNCPEGDPTIGAPAYRVRVACNYFKQTNLSTTELLGTMVSALAVFGRQLPVNRSFSTSNGCLRTAGLQSGFIQYEPTITAEAPSVSAPTVSEAAAAPGPEPMATPEPTGLVNCGDDEGVTRFATVTAFQYKCIS